jgi:hypothetical protein
MSVPRVLRLGALVTLTMLFGSPVARADGPPPNAVDAGDAGDAGASDPPEGGSVGGGGGCSIGRVSALELPPLGVVAVGAALLAASRRRRV